jgi:hypothetical protein
MSGYFSIAPTTTIIVPATSIEALGTSGDAISPVSCSSQLNEPRCARKGLSQTQEEPGGRGSNASWAEERLAAQRRQVSEQRERRL